MLDCPQLKEKTNGGSAKESCFMKNLKWIVIGCVVGIVVIVGIVLLIVNATSFERIQYKECWSNEMVWNDIESLVIPNGVCNEENVTTFDLSRYPKLKRVEIGDYCFKYVGNVTIAGLKKLESVVIGDYSFWIMSDDMESLNSNNHFYLRDCPKLKTLKIGSFSFVCYSVCEIENVNALEVIEMGKLNEDSANFVQASLEMKSDIIQNK